MAATNVKLFYFDIKGKGEPIRLACAYANIPLEDIRVARDEFLAMKEKGELAFGQLPLARFLTASGDTVVSVVQCRAIMHAVGKMSIGSETPIGSDDLKTSAMIDELIDFEEDLFAALRMTMYPTRFCHDAFKDDDAKLARRAKICEEVLNPKLAMLEAKLIANGSKWAAGTETPTIADFLIFTSLYGLTTGNIDGVPTTILSSYPTIMAMYDAFYKLPAIAAYYE